MRGSLDQLIFNEPGLIITTKNVDYIIYKLTIPLFKLHRIQECDSRVPYA